MRAVILAGGYGTRIAEESHLKPKPMLEIGEMPILWHIMKLYSYYGVSDFVICAGYKQHVIKEWFSDYFLHTSDVTFDFSQGNQVIVHDRRAEQWRVTVVDTGLDTMTGGRIRRIQKYIGKESFFLTYGDAVSDVDLNELLHFHKSHGKCVTLTAISLAQQKGMLDIDTNNTVRAFREKENTDSTWVNGGFMVCNPQIFQYLKDDRTVFEQEPMWELAWAGELKSYCHNGFWQCMDTKREMDRLEHLWAAGEAPWKVWEKESEKEREMGMDAIKIKSSLYDYSVNFIDDFAIELKKFADTTAYVIDKNVYSLYRDRFAGIDIGKIYFVDAVEGHKNMETVMEIMAFWQKLGVRKNWKVVCFGGGISQDVTTIASNLFLRNIEWYFFPTTLLSMSDSCIGGKCGINFGKYKNQIGVFYPPKEIFIDVSFIDTLSKEDYINGWGEILKFSLTKDASFYEQIKAEKNYIPCERIAKYIHKGLFVKKAIIEEDEFEMDLRRVLNYGHTFGHALEVYTQNKIPHGKAVIWGMDVVNYIAWKENLISEKYYLDVKKLVKEAFVPEEIVIQKPDSLFEIIKTDKKVKGNIIYLAVLDAPSHLIIYPMKIDRKLKSFFGKYLEETHEYYCN